MGAWAGKILRVDLTNKTHKIEDLDSSFAKDFIGGQGFSSKILYDEVDPTIDALSPKNKLIFTSGALTGTGAVSASRGWVSAKSPLTGTIGFASFGGSFGPELKFAGYDILIVEGSSESPVYIWIDDDQVYIESAAKLWGKNTHITDDSLKKMIEPNSWKARDIHVACIGPAGENKVLMSSVMADKNRAAGRCGLGAVMGSKNLKAVAVRGSHPIPIGKPKEFRYAVKEALDRISKHPVGGNLFPAYGSGSLVEAYNVAGLVPSKNFQHGPVDFDKVANFSGQVIAENFMRRNKACYGCPLSCGGPCVVTNPSFAGRGERPEFETLGLMGGSCGIEQPEAILKINFLCNELGMDTMDVGNTLACAMELYEKNYIPAKDLGFRYLTLNFGDALAAVRLVEMTAYREGFGDTFADGGYRMAEQYGHAELFMGAKKMGFPAYDVRNAHGMGLAVATSTRGACHNRAYTLAAEILGTPVKLDPITEDGKAGLVYEMQNLTAALMDAAGICIFSIAGGHTPEDMYAQLATATDVGLSFEDCMIAGERIWNLQKLYNLKAGITKKDDTIPQRFLKEPAEYGPGKGTVVDLDRMLEEYYAIRSWDKDGVPTPAKLKQLELQ